MKMLAAVKLSPHKYKTPEGYLICQDAILSRTGKQTYMKSELWPETGDDSLIEVDRSAKEVFDQETLASFENKPITCEHPDVNVGPENYNELAVGHINNVRRGKVDGQDVMLADLLITDAQCIEDIENGIRTDLSCGYDCDITEGDHPEQIHIRGNHVALCEQGRAGIARIVDSKNKVKDELEEFTYMGVDVWYGDDGKWHDSNGNNYMGYLEPSDIKHYIRQDVEGIHDSLDKLKSCSKDTILRLMQEEEAAIASYELAIKEAAKKNCEKDLEKYKHILQEEKEHYEELRALLNGFEVEDSIKDRKADIKIDNIDTENYVIGKQNVWFAKAKDESDILTKAFASDDEGKTWYTCGLYEKTYAPSGKTQEGKSYFATLWTHRPRVTIGRNVLSWYSNHGIHEVDSNLEIDHIDENFKNDKLNNLQRISHIENIRKHYKSDSITDSISKGSLIQEFGKQGKQYKIAKIVGNVVYAENLVDGKIVLFKKDEENIEWAGITKADVKDSIIKDEVRAVNKFYNDVYKYFEDNYSHVSIGSYVSPYEDEELLRIFDRDKELSKVEVKNILNNIAKMTNIVFHINEEYGWSDGRIPIKQAFGVYYKEKEADVKDSINIAELLKDFDYDEETKNMFLFKSKEDAQKVKELFDKMKLKSKVYGMHVQLEDVTIHDETEFSNKFYSKAIDKLEEHLEKLDKLEEDDEEFENATDVIKQNRLLRSEIENQIAEYKKKRKENN